MIFFKLAFLEKYGFATLFGNYLHEKMLSDSNG